MAEKKLHKLLQRQINRYLEQVPDPISEQWNGFIQAVNAAYISADEDRKMLERTMELNSQELFQANSEMREVYKAFPDQFFRLDKTGIILSYNVGRSSDTFMDPQRLIGKKIQQIPVVDVRSKFESAIQRIQSGEELISVEYSMPIKNSIQHYEARFVSLLEDNIFVIVRNITQRKQDRETLLRAKEDAEAANLAKSQFLANMSHELRTPLNVIMGYSELIQDEAANMAPEELSADLEKIISASKHLLKLINDVLDLSKIEANKMELNQETFSILPQINEISSTVAPLLKINANALKIICADDIGSIYADLLRLKQVIYNLLSNACKFTERGIVTIEVCRDENWIDFMIRDTGIGISDDKIKILFNDFSQVDESSTRQYGGTGLGLSISKHFVEMMGGTILVESLPGEGSLFTARLPAIIPDEDHKQY